MVAPSSAVAQLAMTCQNVQQPKSHETSLCQPRSLQYITIVNMIGLLLGIVFIYRDKGFKKDLMAAHTLGTRAEFGYCMYGFFSGLSNSKEAMMDAIMEFLIIKCIKEYAAEIPPDVDGVNLIAATEINLHYSDHSTEVLVSNSGNRLSGSSSSSSNSSRSSGSSSSSTNSINTNADFTTHEDEELGAHGGLRVHVDNDEDDIEDEDVNINEMVVPDVDPIVTAGEEDGVGKKRKKKSPTKADANILSISSAIKKEFKSRITLMFDAANENMSFCTTKLGDLGIDGIKGNGSLTHEQQACDNAPGYKHFRCHLTGSEMGSEFSKSDAEVLEGMTSPMKLLYDILKLHKMEMKSIRTYVRSFKLIPGFITRDFSVSNNAIGWFKIGIFPFDQRKILSRCKRTGNLNVGQVMEIFEKIEDVLLPIAALNDYLDDNSIEEHLGHLIGKPSRGSTLTQEESSAVHNRDDCCPASADITDILHPLVQHFENVIGLPFKLCQSTLTILRASEQSLRTPKSHKDGPLAQMRTLDCSRPGNKAHIKAYYENVQEKKALLESNKKRKEEEAKAKDCRDMTGEEGAPVKTGGRKLKPKKDTTCSNTDCCVALSGREFISCQPCRLFFCVSSDECESQSILDKHNLKFHK